MAYAVNKSIGKKVEFKGLKGQYLLYFAIGIFGMFIVFLILRFTRLHYVVALIITAIVGVVFVKKVFKMNKKYGTHGVMKMITRNATPRFIISRKPIYKIIKTKR